MVIQLASSSTDGLRSRIATDCRDRWNQQVVEVEKKNAQFIAALEAQGVRITDSKNNGFESFLALCLVEFVFAKPRPLSDIFLFGGSRIPSFASWEASLVGMYKPGPGDDIDIAVYEHQRLRRPCFSLGVDLQKHEDMIAWMRHERGYQAIMFPDNMLGPDLLCKLRLQKGGLTYYVWLAIQAKARESHVTLSDAVRSITPAYYHSKSNENVSAFSMYITMISHIIILQEPKRQQHIQGFRDALKELPDPVLAYGNSDEFRYVGSPTLIPMCLRISEDRQRVLHSVLSRTWYLPLQVPLTG